MVLDEPADELLQPDQRGAVLGGAPADRLMMCGQASRSGSAARSFSPRSNSLMVPACMSSLETWRFTPGAVFFRTPAMKVPCPKYWVIVSGGGGGLGSPVTPASVSCRRKSGTRPVSTTRTSTPSPAPSSGCRGGVSTERARGPAGGGRVGSSAGQLFTGVIVTR